MKKAARTYLSVFELMYGDAIRRGYFNGVMYHA